MNTNALIELDQKLQNPEVIAKIRSFERFIETTNKGVYGMTAIVGRKHYGLNTWKVTIPVSVNTNVEDLIRTAQSLLSHHELMYEFGKKEVRLDKINKYIIYQNGDWSFMRQNGTVIQQDEHGDTFIELVKAAVIVKK